MSYLLDTNIVSETVKPLPDPRVLAWLNEIDEDRVSLSVVTIAEIRFGIERMQLGARRKRLDHWLRDDLAQRFEGRILQIDEDISNAWGVVTARSRDKGKTIGIMDAFLAATAVVHKLTVVTRNISDFSALDIPVLNPFTH